MTSADGRAGSDPANGGAPARSRAERYAAGKALRTSCPRPLARPVRVRLEAQRVHGPERRARRAIARFSMACADQNEKDHASLERAVRCGRVEAVFEEAE